MAHLGDRFFRAYSSAYNLRTEYTPNFPAEMKDSEEDENGYVSWKPVTGTLPDSDYHDLERKFRVLFPASFIAWHKSYYFLDADCSIVRLPPSNPAEPLEDLKKCIDWHVGRKLIDQKLFPFADEGNDTGLLVFDGREPMRNNEFPIRIYDQDYQGSLDGLSPVIFSSFPNMMECLIHYLTEIKTRKDFEIIPEFLRIDPEGAGKTGVDYWNTLLSAQKADFEESGK